MNIDPFAVALTIGTTEGTMKGNNEISGYVSSFNQLFLLIIVFLLVVFLAYFATRFLGTGKMLKLKSQNLHLVDSISLGFQNTIHIVKAGDRFVLVGVSKDRITYLTEIDGNEITEKASDNKKLVTSFEAILGGYMSNLFKKGEADDQSHQVDDEHKKVK